MASINIKKDGQWTGNPVLGFKVGEENLTNELKEKIANGADVDLSDYATKEEVEGLTAADIGAVPAGSLKCFGSLVDLGITTFPTTMEIVANAMPANSMIIIDTRTIRSGGEEEISDWGNTSNGTAYINKGYSIARITMMVVYGSGSSVKGRLYVGSWASTTNTVGWVDYGYDGNASYPGCFYRTVDDVTEWINPPMQLGTEYRTTERHRGKIVYTKVVDMGTVTNGTQVTYYDSKVYPIRYAAYNDAGIAFPLFMEPALNSTYKAWVDVNANKITARFNNGYSTLRIYCQVWYTQT